MLWLQPPPWKRWLLAGVIALAAIWVEFRPAPVVDVLYATEPIAAGETVGQDNTRTRPTPAGLLVPASLGDIAIASITAGDPVLASSTGDPGRQVPLDWWVIQLTVPAGADRGTPVAIVLMDSGRVVPGVVAAAASADPLGSSSGGVAVSPDDSAEVAIASADGRAVVLIAAG